jgi:hypothetical protein
MEISQDSRTFRPGQVDFYLLNSGFYPWITAYQRIDGVALSSAFPQGYRQYGFALKSTSRYTEHGSYESMEILYAAAFISSPVSWITPTYWTCATRLGPVFSQDFLRITSTTGTHGVSPCLFLSFCYQSCNQLDDMPWSLPGIRMFAFCRYVRMISVTIST